jgi:hypothetical protein
MFALVLMVDRKMDFLEAMRTSKKRVVDKGGFFPHLGFIVLVFFIPPLIIHALSALFMPFELLNFIVFPVQILALISAYLFEGDEKPKDTLDLKNSF